MSYLKIVIPPIFMSYSRCLLPRTPVSVVQAFQLPWHIKRDDLLHLSDKNHSYTNGNKLRKFSYLLRRDPLPSTIVSFGGIQSNSMVALASLSQYFNSSFHYFAHRIPQHLLDHPQGNFKAAIEKGMKVHRLDKHAYELLKDTAVLSNQAQEMMEVTSLLLTYTPIHIFR